VSNFSRHQRSVGRHVLDGSSADGGLRRRRKPPSLPLAGLASARGTGGYRYADDDDDLNIERACLLLARIDREQFGLVFEKYYRRVFSYVQRRVLNRAVAEDLVSETFLEAVDGLWRFRFMGLSYGAYLYRLARRRVARYFAAVQQRREEPLRLEEHDKATASEVEAKVEAEQDAQLLAICLRELDNTDQDIVVLYYYEGLQLAQIGLVLGLNEVRVKARLHRARQRLASLLDRPAITDRLSREGRRALAELHQEQDRIRLAEGESRGGGETP